MREVSICALIVSITTGVSSAQTALSPSHPIPAQLNGDNRLPQELTLDHALEILEQRSPLLLAERQREVSAAGDLEQAGKYPNPFLSLETESLTRLGGDSAEQELFLTFAQPIVLGGKRGRSIDVAAALVRATGNEVRAFEHDLRLQLKTVHAELVLAQSDLELANQILTDFDQVIRLSRIRYERGEMAGGELRRVETERLRFLEQQIAAEIALENARAEMLGLFGMPGYRLPFRATPPRYNDESVEMVAVEVLAEDAEKARPEVMAQIERREAARQDVELQKAIGVPDVVPYVGFQRRRDNVLDVRTSFINFGVGFELPFFNRNQGGVSRARADHRREQALEQAVRYQVAVEVRQAHQAYLSQRRRLAFFEDTYIGTSQQARDIVEAAYRMGGETLINFLDASRVYSETLQAYNRAVFDASVALFRLEFALGRELS